jgi:hypothetical protein
MSDNWWLRAIAYTAFSGLGGMIGYTMRTIDGKQPFKLWRVIVEGAGAAFVGVLVMMLCEAMRLSPQWTGVIVGVCGWLGASTTIRMLESVVRNKIGATNVE